MEEHHNTYKYLSILFAIIAVIFAVLYFTKPSAPVSEILSDISASVQECNVRVETWQKANAGQPTTTESAAAQLQSILKDCEEIFKGADSKI
jgi:hypothetical protein